MCFYYTMKMKEGKNGTQTRDDIRAFLQSKKILAIGDPEYTTGAGTFLNTIKPGDVIILREPTALLIVVSNATPYQPDGQFPDFDSWLCWGRKVEILSWYEDDKDWLGIPKFSGTGYLSTCAAIKEENNRALAQKWLKLVKEKSMKSKISQLLLATKNLILTGAPGTGKTHLAKGIAHAIIEEHNGGSNIVIDDFMAFVQFHPSYDYTDFVEGLRPIPPKDGEGNVGFTLQDGTFKAFCKKALAHPQKTFVFIIDEINRGDIAKIFGELFYAIEPGYRGEKGKVKTQYSSLIDSRDVFKNGFYVPENVYIIGTMNDIDRNVESMDFAIRRRFTWKEISPEDTQEQILNTLNDAAAAGEAKARMNRLNSAIRTENQLGSNYCIGAAYFMNLKNNDWSALWAHHLCPLLKEYVRGLPNADELLKIFLAAYNDMPADH